MFTERMIMAKHKKMKHRKKVYRHSDPKKPNMDPDIRSNMPSIWIMVEDMLRTYGGWSKMFRKSAETFDEEVIWYRDKEIGFWVEYAKVLGQEQFKSVVEDHIEEFKIAYPEIKMPKKELRSKLETAILQDGWMPVKTPIIKEIRRLRRLRREEIKCLRKGMTKKSWLKYLKNQKPRLEVTR